MERAQVHVRAYVRTSRWELSTLVITHRVRAVPVLSKFAACPLNHRLNQRRRSK